MNKKGQALVEFILILPVILLILLALIDIGNIFLKKYDLNNTLEVISEMYQNGETEKAKAYCAKEEVVLQEDSNGNMLTITLSEKEKISAPILSNILGKNYVIKESKTIYKENSYE